MRTMKGSTLAVFVPLPLEVAVMFSVSCIVGHSIRHETIVR